MFIGACVHQVKEINLHRRFYWQGKRASEKRGNVHRWKDNLVISPLFDFSQRYLADFVFTQRKTWRHFVCADLMQSIVRPDFFLNRKNRMTIKSIKCDCFASSQRSPISTPSSGLLLFNALKLGTIICHYIDFVQRLVKIIGCDF